MGDSLLAVPADSTGKKARTRSRTIASETMHEPYYIEVDERVCSYRGRVCTFRTPGRAAAQNIFALWNNTGSSVLVDVRRIVVDVVNTAVRAIGAEAPLVRVVKLTAVPTNGSLGSKAPLDTSMSSSASLTVWQDASADRTLSAVALAMTPTATLTQEYAARSFTTSQGQEAADCIVFNANTLDITLAATEGVGVQLDLAAGATNPATDIWTVMCEWLEYTLP